MERTNPETEFFILNLGFRRYSFYSFFWCSVSKVKLFMMHAYSVAVNMNVC